MKNFLHILIAFRGSDPLNYTFSPTHPSTMHIQRIELNVVFENEYDLQHTRYGANSSSFS